MFHRSFNHSMLLFLILNSFMLANALSFCDQKATFTAAVSGEAHGGYYISVGMGTPIQTFNLLIDTGSSNFAIAAAYDQTNNSFDYNKSETFQKCDKTVTIKYTEGSWVGFLGRDKVYLCPETSCSSLIQFACITSSKNVFEKNTRWNGILGLAYSSIAKPDNFGEPFFESLVFCGTPNIFSLSLCGPFVHSKEMISTEGQLQLGYKSEDFYSGEILYTPILKEWYYDIVVTDIKVGDKYVDVTCMEINTDKSIIDTGTTYLAFPQAIYDLVIEELRLHTLLLSLQLPERFWTQQSVACLTNSKSIDAFPSITLSLFNYNYTTFRLVIPPSLYILKVSKPSEDGICVKLALSPTKTGTVIGATVLKGFYVVFDRKKERVGFANSTCSEFPTMSESIRPMVLKPTPYAKEPTDCLYSDNHNFIHGVNSYVLCTLGLVSAVPMCYVLVSCLYRKWLICKKKRCLEKNSLVHDINMFD